jgi:hypothetical protein
MAQKVTKAVKPTSLTDNMCSQIAAIISVLVFELLVYQSLLFRCLSSNSFLQLFQLVIADVHFFTLIVVS